MQESNQPCGSVNRQAPPEVDARALFPYLDRSARTSLSDQISSHIEAAIKGGQLLPGARLPSWRDLATQLGVSRGTVRVAYERLADECWIIAQGPAGTKVATQPPLRGVAPALAEQLPMMETFHRFSAPLLPFQVGVPAQDAFPHSLWSRLVGRAARREAAALLTAPDPCGEMELRREIAAYLAVARGLRCAPEQIIITGGYRPGLLLLLRVLAQPGDRIWTENPGYPYTRRIVSYAGMEPVHVPVDAEGMDVAAGEAASPDARIALVTPGQQAPMGVTMSPQRRTALAAWAESRTAWIVEDDYLGEFQLFGRAAPAMMGSDRTGRVVQFGSFTKTMGPAMRLGFLVVPPGLLPRFAEITTFTAPAPNRILQLALAEMMRQGHFLRHLRKMKRLCAERAWAVAAAMRAGGFDAQPMGLAVLVPLPDGTDDAVLAREALRHGMNPLPFSFWQSHPGDSQRGLQLGVTNITPHILDKCCQDILRILRIGLAAR